MGCEATAIDVGGARRALFIIDSRKLGQFCEHLYIITTLISSARQSSHPGTTRTIDPKSYYMYSSGQDLSFGQLARASSLCNSVSCLYLAFIPAG